MRLLPTLCAGFAILAGVAVALPGPSGAMPALRPAFDDSICHAKPPRLSHAWARGIVAEPPGRAIRVADADIPAEDHAEFLFKLGLLQGHLMVGRELIAANQPRLALPHFGHPVRELYDDIKGELARRGVTGFDAELVSLEALAAGKPRDPATTAKYDEVMRILDALRATVPAGLRNNERFMLGVLGEVITIGGEDYNESIEGGRITKPVEYHDSHGYLAYAMSELARLQARPEGKDSPRLAAARVRLGELQAIVGPLTPPARPVRSVAQYKAVVEAFKKDTAGT